MKKSVLYTELLGGDFFLCFWVESLPWHYSSCDTLRSLLSLFTDIQTLTVMESTPACMISCIPRVRLYRCASERDSASRWDNKESCLMFVLRVRLHRHKGVRDIASRWQSSLMFTLNNKKIIEKKSLSLTVNEPYFRTMLYLRSQIWRVHRVLPARRSVRQTRSHLLHSCAESCETP